MREEEVVVEEMRRRGEEQREEEETRRREEQRDMGSTVHRRPVSVWWILYCTVVVLDRLTPYRITVHTGHTSTTTHRCQISGHNYHHHYHAPVCMSIIWH
jgi:hypothetical protein